MNSKARWWPRSCLFKLQREKGKTWESHEGSGRSSAKCRKKMGTHKKNKDKMGTHQAMCLSKGTQGNRSLIQKVSQVSLIIRHSTSLQPAHSQTGLQVLIRQCFLWQWGGIPTCHTIWLGEQWACTILKENLLFDVKLPLCSNNRYGHNSWRLTLSYCSPKMRNSSGKQEQRLGGLGASKLKYSAQTVTFTGKGIPPLVAGSRPHQFLLTVGLYWVIGQWVDCPL